jgi:hypothetical protein
MSSSNLVLNLPKQSSNYVKNPQKPAMKFTAPEYVVLNARWLQSFAADGVSESLPSQPLI